MAEQAKLDTFVTEKEPRKNEEHGSFNLPREWKWVGIDELVAEFQSGFACSKKYTTETGIPHLRPNNIGFYGELDLSELVLIPTEMVDLQKYSLKEGDVLFNNTNSKELVGRACLVKKDLDYGFSNHITRLRVNKQIVIQEWLALSINYLWVKGHFLEICRKWIGQAGVNTAMLKSTKIPLPPLEDQKRMVARVEELFGKAEEAKRLRRIAKDQAEKIVQAAQYKVFSRAEGEGWEWLKLKAILKKDRQTINPQEYPNKEFSLITMDCVESNTGRLLKDIRCFGKHVRSMKYKFNRNHILYGKLRPYLNKVYTPDTKGICTTEFFPFVVINAVREYVAFFLRSEKVVNYAMRHITGTRQPRVIIDAFLEYPIPVPPIAEQERIVTYLDTVRENVENLRKLQQRTEEELENLIPAVLDKAFKGEL